MTDIQIEKELIHLIHIEAYLERSLKTVISKKEKQQIKQTRKQLEEARITLLEFLEAEKLTLQK